MSTTQAAGNGINAISNFTQGNIAIGTIATLGDAQGLAGALRACFAAETRIVISAASSILINFE